jgi:hypothetical protein
MGELVTLPDLGVTATVVMDEHNWSPRTVDDSIKDDWKDFGVGFLEDVRIISHWAAHVALFALQNPTPQVIARALELLYQSGDFDEWLEPEGDRVALVQEPPGWRE